MLRSDDGGSKYLWGQFLQDCKAQHPRKCIFKSYLRDYKTLNETGIPRSLWQAKNCSVGKQINLYHGLIMFQNHGMFGHCIIPCTACQNKLPCLKFHQSLKVYVYSDYFNILFKYRYIRQSFCPFILWFTPYSTSPITRDSDSTSSSIFKESKRVW